MFAKKNESPALPGSQVAATDQNAVLAKVAEAYLKEQKWKRIFKFLLLIVVFLFVLSLFSGGNSASVANSKPHTALVELQGPIGIEGGVWAQQINHSLKKAFEAKHSKGVVLHINSPGGSPVQSDQIYTQMLRLRQIYPGKPLHVVVSDVCASGGYYVAAAADQIYGNPSSIVGSIGVRMDSFGFVGTLEKLGIERRSLTAGTNKAILDPFLPVKPAQQAHAQEMLNIVHQQFITKVKAGRGDRLGDNPDLFSGLFWSGEQALNLGLIDDYGSIDSVARDVLGYAEVVDYTYRPPLIDQLARDLGIYIGQGMASVMGGGLQIQ